MLFYLGGGEEDFLGNVLSIEDDPEDSDGMFVETDVDVEYIYINDPHYRITPPA